MFPSKVGKELLSKQIVKDSTKLTVLNFQILFLLDFLSSFDLLISLEQFGRSALLSVSLSQSCQVFILVRHFSIFLDFNLFQMCCVFFKTSIDVLQSGDEHYELYVFSFNELL